MAEFFEMGGYGAYVWPAYGLSFLVLAGLGAGVWLRGRTLKERLAKLSAPAENPDRSVKETAS